MPRLNRGSTQLAVYDDAYDQEEVEYEPVGPLQLNCCANCSQSIVFHTNIGLAIIAVALTVAAVFAYFSSSSYGLSVLLLALIVCACAPVLVYSAIGTCAGSAQKSWPVFLYIIALLLAILTQATVVGLILNPTYAKSSMKKSYESLSDKKREDLESKLNCCSFDAAETTDRCIAQAVDSDCYDEMKKRLQRFEIPITAACLILMLGEVMLLVFSVAVQRGIASARMKKKSTSRKHSRVASASHNL